MTDPQVRAVREKVELVADRAMMTPDAPRSARVEVTLQDGRTVNHFTRFASGTRENPLTTAQVNAKARDLMTPVLGAQRTETLITRLNALETVASIRELRPLLAS
jgi:2-methylcitrate dehydratase PrpD